MNGETASWIFYSGLLMYGLVLFAFKRLYLDTLGSRVLSYMLGLVLAYGILAGVFLASRESMVVRTVLQEAAAAISGNNQRELMIHMAGNFLAGIGIALTAGGFFLKRKKQ